MMNISKLFSMLTLAAFVGVVACEPQDDAQFDDPAPAAEEPAPAPETDPAFEDETWEDDTWEEDDAWDDTLDEDEDEEDPATAY